MGLLNIVSGLFGGIPGYHALSLTALAKQMDVDGRGAGLVAALVPLATVAFGASIVGIDPSDDRRGRAGVRRVVLPGAWLIDMRRSLPAGRVPHRLGDRRDDRHQGHRGRAQLGLILAVMLFAVNYGRVDLVREVRSGPRIAATSTAHPVTGRSSRPCRAGPDPPPERVRVLRNGERTPRTDPQTRGGRTDPVPAARPAPRHRRGRIGRVSRSARSHCSPRRAGSSWCSPTHRIGCRASATRRFGRHRRRRPVRAGPGSRPAAM